MLLLPTILAGSAASMGGGMLLLLIKRSRRRRRNTATAPSPNSPGPAGESHPLQTPLGARLRPTSEGYSITVGLMQDVASGLREIPPFPPALLQILQELDDAGSSAQSVADIVARDQSLAAVLLRIANSASLGIDREITTISDAVAYLGFSTTKALFLRLKMGSMFVPVSLSGCYDGKKLWSHSVAVAQVSEELARRVGGTNPHLALTAGLLHDIGKIAINSRSPATVRELWAPQSADESFLSRERRLFGADHAIIGAHLAKQWRLPRGLVEMIRLHHLSEGQPAALDLPARRALYAVFVANQLVKYCHVYCSQMEIDPIPDFVAAELRIPAAPEKLLDDAMRQKIQIAVSLTRRSAASHAAQAAA